MLKDKIKTGIVWLICLLVSSIGKAGIKPFESVKITLITETPGAELYSVYGHTAFRIRESETGKDYIFHYGLFDFNAPGFYTNFLKGILKYKMGGQYFSSLYRTSEEEGRGLYEQELNLDSSETMQLYNILHENYKRENRAYLYDFLYENCSTKPRDLLEKLWGSRLKYPDSFPKKTYRQVLSEHQRVLPWIDYGIDLIIGSEVDKEIGIRDQAFLPEYLKKALSAASLDGQKAVFKERELIVPSLQRTVYFYQRPVFYFLLLFLLELFIFIYVLRSGVKRWIRLYDMTFYTLISLMSIFIMLLWWGTDHHITKHNWNLLWLNPLYLILTTAGWIGWRSLYEKTRLILMLITVSAFVLGIFHTFVQPFHISSFVLMAILILKLGRALLLNFAMNK